MQIVKLDKEKLNEFLAIQDHGEFLQSGEWGELLKKDNGKVFRIGIEEHGKLVGVASFVKKTVFGFNYFFCPRGPVVAESEKLKVASFLFAEIEKAAKREKAIFFRFEPIFNIQSRELGVKLKRSVDVEPSKTAIVNLEKDEEKLLSAMHPKTRYNIRLAEKRGVKIKEGGKDDFDNFWRIMKETVARDGFRLHSKGHYQKMLELDNSFVRLFLAEYNSRIVAAVLSVFFGDTITYVHGASANKDRNVMAPYLLHWHIIKLGKSLGYKYYDFNGIDEHKWPGVTRFKIGFGGAEVDRPGTFDLVLKESGYNIYKILRSIRRKL
ncbi:MAG: Lipid II:glycine glycyltransferase [Parcubacteria group bacterium ADurb.Bin316]|nr:MAG: Lipid II:glycine glycyltransferase [Parcubacteria group bacterium ADurb.Bin316]HOZ56164.1 peptidoglycan bridge formation glycyltransferase FemA/FemB family protein [bacterium]